MKYPDFNEFLHALRTRELRRMPGGAQVFLSAGCSGRWYFDWIHENYPGIQKHLGIEAFSPKPADLPPEVDWMPDDLYAMKSVHNRSVDLVFAGQTVEHLWPKDITGFLLEANRVLNDEGWLVLDSPNRLITNALGWWQPEHTCEFTISEMLQLLRLAGFQPMQVRGIWLCYSQESHSLLPLTPDLETINIVSDSRVTEGNLRPEDSFIWWIEAKKDPVARTNPERLHQLAEQFYNQQFAHAIHRTYTPQGFFPDFQMVNYVKAALHQVQYLRFGPYMPLKPGSYEIVYEIILDPFTYEEGNLDDVALVLDISSDHGKNILKSRSITRGDIQAALQAPGPLSAQSRQSLKIMPCPVEFDLSRVAFGVEYRILSTGATPLTVNANITFTDLAARRNFVLSTEASNPA